MPLSLLQRGVVGGGGGRRKVNLSVCKPMKGMKILSKYKLQYLPMEGLVFVWPNVIQGT